MPHPWPTFRLVINPPNSFEDEYLSTWMKQRPRGRRDSDLRAWLKRSQQLKRDRKQMDGSLKRLERKTKFRGGKRDQK